MLKIELRDYGVEDILRKISCYLESAIKLNSKKEKNEIICKALGAINTLYYVISVEEVDDTETKAGEEQ